MQCNEGGVGGGWTPDSLPESQHAINTSQHLQLHKCAPSVIRIRVIQTACSNQNVLKYNKEENLVLEGRFAQFVFPLRPRNNGRCEEHGPGNSLKCY